MLKRKFDEMLSQGKGRQLLWLFGLCLALILLAVLVSKFVFRDGALVWQDVVAIFLSAGAFRGAGVHDVFRLMLALLGVFLFSALLVSVVKNIFDNISESVRKGRRYYRVHDHVLILGGGRHLSQMLRELSLQEDEHDVLVMTSQDVEQLRDKLQADTEDRKFTDKIIFYAGGLNNMEVLVHAHPEKAYRIYIIGEDDEPDHDSLSLDCLTILDEVCWGAERKIPCFLLMESATSMDIFNYSEHEITQEGSFLQVELVSNDEYNAECLFRQVKDGVPFIPTLRKQNAEWLHLVIVGTDQKALAVSATAAHICHFPDFTDGRRRHTQITFLAPGAGTLEQEFKAVHENIFSVKGLELDVDWNFREGNVFQEDVRRDLVSWLEAGQVVRVVFCQRNLENRAKCLIHLPREVYGHPNFASAIYLDSDSWFIHKAQETEMYGTIFTFGPAEENADPLFVERFAKGKRANHVYATHGHTDQGDVDAEWNALSRASRFSSVYSANGYDLRRRCFDFLNKDRRSVYEAEHRRWVMSELLMGFWPVTDEERKVLDSLQGKPDEFKEKADEYKRCFRHHLIREYVDETDRDLNRLFIDHIDYILGDNGE